MKRAFAAILALAVFLCAASFAEERVDSLTYAVFSYLPDPGYYQELIERRWAETEPDIRLIRAEWDCYTGEPPEGIDVIMYDAVMLDSLVAAGWIQPIALQEVHDSEGIFPFALSGLTVEGRLYGIPVFLCGNFLIYDQRCEAAAAAAHLTDLAGLPECLVINSENAMNKPQYLIEVIADTQGAANPSADGSLGDAMQLIDSLAIGAHKRDEDSQVAMAYDVGAGLGYIGFSESMRLLESRAEATRIKSVSFSDRPDIHRLYVDAVAVAKGVQGQRYEKCLQLINVMADAEVLTALSVHSGAPQYLLLARKSAYRSLSEAFPLYVQLEALAGAEDNHVILTP